MKCLKCMHTFYQQPSWSALFHKQPPALCYACEGNLEFIGEPNCLLCSRSLNKISHRLQKDQICFDCIRWDKRTESKGLLQENRSLLEYNEFLKDWFVQFKFRGDAAAATYFSTKLYQLYKRYYRSYTVVAIPLSFDSLKEREFNQVELMTQSWTCNRMILHRLASEKQSKRTRSDRIARVKDSPFYVEKIPEKDLLKKVVLIDDIYTTGTTVRQAARTLKEAGAEVIASLTVAR
ncbi:ComF family protein [Alkalicoccobacillus porphyridii]|uniref:ComF family protein n=1 Tax=Alkalicoccobacillus porphyridii TaxID=2597270 RepID=A0A554A3T7_9BACI|nr:phosphoribosyltransferase family protein [Alkalicoccobacillus porphyridii]TSB48345.1 ComF family protein [Alkalicoccobacillus porphyridii]